VAVTGTTSASPAASATGTDHQTSRGAASSEQTQASDAASRPSKADTAPDISEAPKQKAVPAPFSLSYHFDEQTQRMILEARDPASGFVVFQMPPKYIIKQFTTSAGGTAAATRGAKLDNAI
jgi:hypothetical protein